jgi:hypothetical protein
MIEGEQVFSLAFFLSAKRLKRSLLPVVCIGCLLGCSAKFLHRESSQDILKNEAFEQAIKVKEIAPNGGTAAAPKESRVATLPGQYVRFPGPPPVPEAFAKITGKTTVENGYAKPGVIVGKKTGKPEGNRGEAKTEGLSIAQPSAHEPSIEDGEGFLGRRPQVDPFRVGEKVVLEASYFGVVAGDIILEVRPFVEVNGRKSYRFTGTAQSTSVFAMFYAVDDWFETFVDFETLVPYSYALHVKESKQLRETRSIFNWDKMTASFWDKRITSEGEVEEKKYDWDIPSYSQNVFTTAFYLRGFALKPGKKVAFRLAHEKENMVVTGEILRRERIETPAGEFNTVVVKPKIELNGVFRPVGDIFIWLTDDDRKFIVRIESKIKIGKIVAVAKAVEPGRK